MLSAIFGFKVAEMISLSMVVAVTAVRSRAGLSVPLALSTVLSSSRATPAVQIHSLCVSMAPCAHATWILHLKYSFLIKRVAPWSRDSLGAPVAEPHPVTFDDGPLLFSLLFLIKEHVRSSSIQRPVYSGSYFI